MRKALLLAVVGAVVFPANAQVQSDKWMMRFRDFNITLPLTWLAVKPLDEDMCDIEGPERKDGSSPRVSIASIPEDGRTDAQIRDDVLKNYEGKLNVAESKRLIGAVAGLNAVGLDIQFHLKGQPNKRFEEIRFRMIYLIIRASSQKQIYLIRWSDTDENFEKAKQEANSVINSFHLTH